MITPPYIKRALRQEIPEGAGIPIFGSSPLERALGQRTPLHVPDKSFAIEVDFADAETRSRTQLSNIALVTDPFEPSSGPIQEKWRRPTPFALLLPRI